MFGRVYVTNESMQTFVTLGRPFGDVTRKMADGSEEVKSGHAGRVQDLHEDFRGNRVQTTTICIRNFDLLLLWLGICILPPVTMRGRDDGRWERMLTPRTFHHFVGRRAGSTSRSLFGILREKGGCNSTKTNAVTPGQFDVSVDARRQELLHVIRHGRGHSPRRHTDGANLVFATEI